MSLEYSHDCSECGDDRGMDSDCYCKECVKQKESDAYDEGKKEGIKEASLNN
jgi:hypothetical protein